MSAGFTPGPWRFERHANPASQYLGNIVGSYGANEYGIEQIRTITCQTLHGEPDEREANAHLIAAAPDLYEALEAMLSAIPPCDVSGSLREATSQAREALAKARGEA